MGEDGSLSLWKGERQEYISSIEIYCPPKKKKSCNVNLLKTMYTVRFACRLTFFTSYRCSGMRRIISEFTDITWDRSNNKTKFPILNGCSIERRGFSLQKKKRKTYFTIVYSSCGGINWYLIQIFSTLICS